MRLLNTSGTLALAIVALLLQSSPARAQATITTTDIQRLQDDVYQASRDIQQLRSRDSQLASQLQSELDDARDEVTYLRVKLRKNEPIASADYADLRDRIDNIRSRARGDATGGYTAPASGGRWDPNRSDRSTGS